MYRSLPIHRDPHLRSSCALLCLHLVLPPPHPTPSHRGAFSDVFKATSRADPTETVAIKQIKKFKVKNKEDITREIDVLQRWAIALLSFATGAATPLLPPPTLCLGSAGAPLRWHGRVQLRAFPFRPTALPFVWPADREPQHKCLRCKQTPRASHCVHYFPPHLSPSA